MGNIHPAARRSLFQKILLEEITANSVARVPWAWSHDVYSVPGRTTLRLSNPMVLDIVDLVWSAMGYGEFYTPRDLANSSGQPIQAVTRVLAFLTRYGFAEVVVKREPIFRKVPATPAPGDAHRILQLLIKDDGVSARQESDERVRFVEGPEMSPEFLPTRPLSREKRSFNLGLGP